MRRPKVFNVVVCAALAGFSITAHGDTSDPADGTNDTPPQWNFKPTDPGPTSALWHRADLTPLEQAYVDHAAIRPNAEAINTAYASAMSELAEHARQAAAADALGVDGLGTEGVVP